MGLGSQREDSVRLLLRSLGFFVRGRALLTTLRADLSTRSTDVRRSLYVRTTLRLKGSMRAKEAGDEAIKLFAT